MVAKHLHHVPVSPSERGGVEIPPALEEIVIACLAKSPADRPGSAAELSRLLASVDIPRWTDADAKRWWEITAIGHRPSAIGQTDS
jgi:serine/threonine-protein kinase